MLPNGVQRQVLQSPFDHVVLVSEDKVTKAVSVNGNLNEKILNKIFCSLSSCQQTTLLLDLQAQMAPFVPRQRKHRVRQRLEKHGRKTKSEPNPNAIEILPASKTEHEEKRKALKAEIRGQKQNISSKKQKRLDKYIVKL